jgi:hypothetical protein
MRESRGIPDLGHVPGGEAQVTVCERLQGKLRARFPGRDVSAFLSTPEGRQVPSGYFPCRIYFTRGTPEPLAAFELAFTEFRNRMLDTEFDLSQPRTGAPYLVCEEATLRHPEPIWRGDGRGGNEIGGYSMVVYLSTLLVSAEDIEQMELRRREGR